MTPQRPPEMPAPEPNVPVTPMLDMTFQLFAFFVFTYSPQSLEGRLDFALPPQGGIASLAMPDVEAGEETLTIVARSVQSGPASGNLSQLLIRTRVGDIAVANLDELQQYLGRPETRPQRLEIAAESRLRWAVVIDLMDLCNRCGIQRVGLAAPPDGPE